MLWIRSLHIRRAHLQWRRFHRGLALTIVTVAAHAAVLEKGSIREKQQALAALATLPDPEADRVLLRELDRYAERELPAALWLDLFEAAAQRTDARIKERLAERERSLAASRDPVQRWRECLEGGDAKAGREIFAERAEAGCIRCHRVNGLGGEIGPELTGLGLLTERVFILESIVEPNATISPGYGSFLLKLKNGESMAGVVNIDGSEEVVITSLGGRQTPHDQNRRNRRADRAAQPDASRARPRARETRDPRPRGIHRDFRIVGR